MKKIPSLFKRNYGGDRLVYDEVVPASEWVLSGEGLATVKYDGTACLISENKLYKRYDRKLTKRARRCHFDKEGNRITIGPIPELDFKPAPNGWMPCEDEPNENTGHWPGWVSVGHEPEDKWHRQAWIMGGHNLPSGTYELVGPKIQNNPYCLESHQLWVHGGTKIFNAPRTYEKLCEWFTEHEVEGIVWHHPDGRMVKVKRTDWGLPWPPYNNEPSL